MSRRFMLSCPIFMAQREVRFVRLDPPVRATLFEGGRAFEVAAVGLHPEAVLVEPPPGLPAGARLEAELSLAGGALRVAARIEAEAGGRAALWFEDLDEPARARLEAFITRNRKADHIRICRDEDVSTEGVTAGFERFRLPHEALPEIDKRAIDLSTCVFGRRLAAPILISCMTGGSELAKTVNRRLAAVAGRYGLALGLGSQRAMLKSPELADTYAVRDLAPEVLLIGNVGAVQLNYGLTVEDCERLLREVGADALALHLNPLQEAVQPEGDVNFAGLKARIAALAASLSRPVILKEVGSGISRGLARWVRGTAIAAVDVAGAGGTNWAKVESHRAQDPLTARLGRSFAGWGIPTADSLQACREELGERPVFASGGIRNGIEAAKAIALGADLVGIARPFLEAAARSEEAVEETARLLIEELRVAMFCCGAADVGALRRTKLERV
jgi:isopentenyl-diphosphate delta-isomerase